MMDLHVKHGEHGHDKHEVLKRLTRGENIYLLNTWEGVAVRIMHIDGQTHFYLKFSGELEYEVKPYSSVVVGAWRELNEMTKEQYDNF